MISKAKTDAFGKEAKVNTKPQGWKRKGNFAPIRFDPVQVRKLRNKLIVKMAYCLAVVFLMIGGGKYFKSAAEVTSSMAVVDREVLVSLESQPQMVEEAQNNEELLISPVFMNGVQRWAADIRRWSEEYELPPAVIATIMQIESCGDNDAVSSAGAAGLFQVMPFHFGVGEEHFDPEVNAFRGLTYLKQAWELADHDLHLTFAGYNGGLSVIDMDPNLWWDETKRFVYWGTGIYVDAESGAVRSGRLTEWLNAGGDSLCRQAAVSLSQ